MDDIELKIKNIVSRQLGIPVTQISTGSKFISDLGGDSLDTVEMVLTLEDEFGIEVEEEVAEELHTVQAVIDLIKSRTSLDH
jgi:acyl carrier protein